MTCYSFLLIIQWVISLWFLTLNVGLHSVCLNSGFFELSLLPPLANVVLSKSISVGLPWILLVFFPFDSCCSWFCSLQAEKSRIRAFILVTCRVINHWSLFAKSEREFGIATTDRQKMLLAIAACAFKYKAFKLSGMEMFFSVIRLNIQMKENKSSTF